MREAFPAATTIGADDKIPIFQGGADKLLPFHLLSKEIKGSIYVTANSSTTINANDIKSSTCTSASKWTNTPLKGIGILNTYAYSPGWIVQKFFIIDNPLHRNKEFMRTYYGGETWSPWVSVEYK